MTKIKKKEMKHFKIGTRVRVKRHKTMSGYRFGGYIGEITGVFDQSKTWINYNIFPDCWLKFSDIKSGSVVENGEYLIKL